MAEPRDEPLDPDSVTDWAEWGREHGSRWGKEWSGRAQQWGSEAWSWSHPRDAASRPWWSRLFWGIVGLPSAVIGAVLVAALALLGLVALLLFGALLLWLAMGVASGVFASQRGWPGQLGSLFGFALGPIGLLIVRRLPERR